MKIFARGGIVLASATLASGMLVGGASVSSAATCGYPPGRCSVSFDKSSFKPGQHVDLLTHKHVFRKHEMVDGHVHCKPSGKSFDVGPFKAGKKGRVNADFELPDHIAGHNTCTLKLVGEKSGHHATGHFTIHH